MIASKVSYKNLIMISSESIIAYNFNIIKFIDFRIIFIHVYCILMRSYLTYVNFHQIIKNVSSSLSHKINYVLSKLREFG